MKRMFFLIAFTVSIILLFSANNTCATDYKSEIKVGLKYGGDTKAFSVSSGGGIMVYNAQSGALLYTAGNDEQLYIEAGSTGFAALGKFSAENTLKISLQPQNGSLIYCDGKPYRGYILAELKAAEQICVMNVLGTDDYVASVLGKEMSYTWPIEALKAQAVCARNYVLCRGNAHKGYDFDVCATTHCQVYGGYESEHENTRRAVNETKNIVAKYQGKPVALYFFATSGGYTENCENVWGNEVGYLKAVEDKYENPQKASRYNWNVTLTRTQIEEKLKNAGANIGTLKSIAVNEVSSSGRVTKLTFTGSESSYTAKLEKCRTVLGLYSQKFSITSDGAASAVTTAGKADAPLSVLSADGLGKPVALKAINGAYSIGEVSLLSAESENYIITGHGYGHGVGMSQWGARGMAESGFSYTDILHHYFTNITLD